MVMSAGSFHFSSKAPVGAKVTATTEASAAQPADLRFVNSVPTSLAVTAQLWADLVAKTVRH